MLVCQRVCWFILCWWHSWCFVTCMAATAEMVKTGPCFNSRALRMRTASADGWLRRTKVSISLADFPKSSRTIGSSQRWHSFLRKKQIWTNADGSFGKIKQVPEKSMVFSVISWQRHGLPPGGSLSLTTLHGFRHIGTARLTRTWPSVCNSNIMYVYIYNVYIYIMWYDIIWYCIIFRWPKDM